MSHKAFFFFGNTKVESEKASATGTEIKAMIKACVPDFDTTHILVLEGHGKEEDRTINDTDEVSLAVGHGEGPKHFFSKPPTNFGGEKCSRP